jgi:hypothetical protein
VSTTADKLEFGRGARTASKIGKDGEVGPKGRTGLRGIIGPGGPQGKAGFDGNPGLKGLKGDPGESGAAGAGAEISLVAASSFPAFSAVTSAGALANSSNLAHYGKVVGLNALAATLGFVVAVRQIGELTNGAWSWSIGDVIFLNGTTLSKVPPSTGFVQQLGVARSATTIVIEMYPPILL